MHGDLGSPNLNASKMGLGNMANEPAIWATALEVGTGNRRVYGPVLKQERNG